MRVRRNLELIGNRAALVGSRRKYLSPNHIRDFPIAAERFPHRLTSPPPPSTMMSTRFVGLAPALRRATFQPNLGEHVLECITRAYS